MSLMSRIFRLFWLEVGEGELCRLWNQRLQFAPGDCDLKIAHPNPRPTPDSILK